MAKKKRKPARTRVDTAPPAMGGTNIARRERKEEARAAREAARRRQARTSALRRALTFGAVGFLAVAAITFIGRAASPTPLSDAAKTAASEAGCGDLDTSVADSAPGGEHLATGETTTYPDPPGTSGKHAQTWLLPENQRVYTAPVEETQAVHTLEHGGVIVYYRLPAEGGVTQDVVDALDPIVKVAKATYLIPYPNLPEGQALALTAWNTRMFCPAAITVAQATALVQGFADSFACTSNAPEGNKGDGC